MSVTKSIGTTIVGAIEPPDSDLDNNTFALYVEGDNVKIKYKDGSGVVIVYTVHTSPPLP